MEDIEEGMWALHTILALTTSVTVNVSADAKNIKMANPNTPLGKLDLTSVFVYVRLRVPQSAATRFPSKLSGQIDDDDDLPWSGRG